MGGRGRRRGGAGHQRADVVEFGSEEVNEVVTALICSFSRKGWLGLQKMIYYREKLLGVASVFID